MIDEIRLVEKSKWFIGASEEEPYGMGWNECNEHWMKAVDERPKVSEWIPCSERLPEDTTTKAITLSNGVVDSGYFSEGKWWCIGDSIRLEVKTKGVVAWMPLPEPYKEGETDG